MDHDVIDALLPWGEVRRRDEPVPAVARVAPPAPVPGEARCVPHAMAMVEHGCGYNGGGQ